MAFMRFTDEGDVEVLVTFDATERESHIGSAVVSEHPIETGGNVTDHVRADNRLLTLDVMISNTPLGDDSHDARNLLDEPQKISHLDGAAGSVQPATLFFATPRRRLTDPRLLIEGNPPMALNDILPGVGLAANIAGHAGAPAPLGVGLNAITTIDVIPAIDPKWEEGEMAEGSQGDVGVQILEWVGDFDRVAAVNELLDRLREVGQLVDIITGLRSYEDMVIEGWDVDRNAQSGSAIRGTLSARQIRKVDSQTVQVTQPLEPRGQKQSKRGKQVPTAASDQEVTIGNLIQSLLVQAGLKGR